VPTERDGARPHYPRMRVGFGEFAKCTRAIKRKYAREEGDVGLQQRRELTLTRLSLRQARGFVLPASRVTRARCVTIHVHAHPLQTVLFAPKQKPKRLTACRYISQPCYILPSISSPTSPSWVGLEILHGHRDTRTPYYNGTIPR